MSTENLDVLSLTFPRYIPLNKQRMDLFLLSPWMSFDFCLLSVSFFFLIWAERSLKSIPDERERKREEVGERGREGERGKGGWRGGTMTLQRAKNLIHVKQHYGVSFCKRIYFYYDLYS